MKIRGNVIDLIESFAYIWLIKGNQYEFRKHPKTRCLDKELEPLTFELPVQCSAT